MSDLLKLLDGSIDDLKAGLAGKSKDELNALRAAETDGKTRAGALSAIDAALEAYVSPQAPSIDEDLRANATDDQNRIDFNHPTLTQTEQVIQNLVEANLADQRGE